MERFAYWFAWFNLVASTAGWAISAAVKAAVNTTEPPIVMHLSWYAIWQGSLIFIVSAHVNKKA